MTAISTQSPTSPLPPAQSTPPQGAASFQKALNSKSTPSLAHQPLGSLPKGKTPEADSLHQERTGRFFGSDQGKYDFHSPRVPNGDAIRRETNETISQLFGDNDIPRYASKGRGFEFSSDGSGVRYTHSAHEAMKSLLRAEGVEESQLAHRIGLFSGALQQTLQTQGIDQIQNSSNYSNYPGSGQNYAYGQTVNQITHGATGGAGFASVLNDSGGLVGSGDSVLVNPPYQSTLPYNVSVPINNHAINHDASGFSHNTLGQGPGYNYTGAPDIFPTSSPYSGQVSGIVASALRPS